MRSAGSVEERGGAMLEPICRTVPALLLGVVRAGMYIPPALWP